MILRRNLLRSRQFRMAGLYAGTFAVLSAASLGLMFGLYQQEARRELETALERETESLAVAYHSQGPEGVRLYAQALRLQPMGERWSLVLSTPEGRMEIPEGRDQHVARDDDLSLAVALSPTVTAELRVSQQVQREALRVFGRTLASGVVGLVLLALGGGVLLAWFTDRRIAKMDRALAGIMQGDLGARLPVRPHGDELDRLAANVNLALDRVQQLMMTVRSATDGIAHDLRTPLARHRARIEAALHHTPSPQALPQWFEEALAEVDRILATFRGLLSIATVEAGNLRAQFAPVDLATLALQMADLYEPLAAERGISIRVRGASRVELQGSRDLLAQTLANLIDNAIKYSPDGSEIEVSVGENGDRVELSVADRGPGIPVDEREKVFQRLYRLDASRNTPGLGLGLSLVKAVAELHRGQVHIEDRAPGSKVCVELQRGRV